MRRITEECLKKKKANGRQNQKQREKMTVNMRKNIKENKSKKYLLFQFLIKTVTDFGTNLLRQQKGNKK